MTHKAFFGDREREFALTPELITELERTSGSGIAAFSARFMQYPMTFHFSDIIETIRLGLIGGGVSPKDAQSLVATYAKPRPIIETFPLATAILETVWFGSATATEIPQDDLGHADTAAEAVAEALEQVAL